MEEISASQSPPQPAADATVEGGGTAIPASGATTRKWLEGSSSALSRGRRGCASFAVSVQEGFRYIKALIFGQAKKMTARTEEEATEADMQTYKMQVDAADSAEDSKKKLDKTA